MIYKLKEDSVSGRFFIWQLTTDSIFDKPVFGHGYNSFCHTFNDYQAKFFSNPSNDDDKFIQLADNSTFAFNEFLQVAAELGVVGLFLFAGLFILAIIAKSDFLENEDDSIIKVSFLVSKVIVGVVIISSFFSYPMHIIPIQVVLFIALAIISSYSHDRIQFKIKLPLIVRRIFIFLLVILIIGAYSVSGISILLPKHWTKLMTC